MRIRHLPALLAATALAVVALAAPAHANTYDVHVCDTFGTGSGLSLTQSPVNFFFAASDCNTGFPPNRRVRLVLQDVGNVLRRGQSTGWSFGLPPFSLFGLSGISYDVSDIGTGWHGSLSARGVADGADVLELRPLNIGRPLTGHFDVTAPLGARSLGAVLRCDFNQCLDEDDALAFSNIVVHAIDNELPDIQFESGPLRSGRTVGGTVGLHVAMQDIISGAAGIAVQIDNRQVSTFSGTCPGLFVSLQPCSTSLAGDLTVDTTRFNDGPHTAAVVVSDAAGNIVSDSFGVSIDNSLVNAGPPLLSGNAVVGETLSATTGAWVSAQPVTFGFQWLRCPGGTSGTSGIGCTAIFGATSPSYTVAPADGDQKLLVVVTADNGAHRATASTLSALVSALPFNDRKPALVGTAQVGSSLQADQGDWSGSGTPSFRDEWLRCDTSGVSCAAISGAIGPLYTVTGADIGFRLRLHVTATNTSGSTTADSNPSAVVVAAPPQTPVNSATPRLFGITQVGQSVGVDQGQWSGGGNLTFTDQWLRCDSVGDNCVDLPGATGPLYTLTGADVGHRVVARVTATNEGGSASALSFPSGLVDPAPGNVATPANTAKPSVIGTAAVGASLSADVGSWSGGGSLTFSEQWQRCDTAGANCTAIIGATGPLYTVTGADVDHRLTVVVTARNQAGSASATSDPTAAATAGGGSARVPANATKPVVIGTPAVGTSLGVDQGTWSGGGNLTFTDQWLRCDVDGSSCTAISGATGPLYTVTGADADHRLQVRVTARNEAGSASAASDPSAVASDPTSGGGGGSRPSIPANVTKPTLFGTAAVGTSLSVDSGSWSGGGTLAFTDQWLRCDASGASCVDISGATGPLYTATGADVDHRLAVRVTASNEAGSAPVLTDPSAVVTDPTLGGTGARVPANATKPVVIGTPLVGTALGVDQGAWSGGGSLAFMDQWLRCDADGSSCAAIAGATGPLYTVTGADADHRLAVRVTASNEAGFTAASSDPSAVASDPTSGGGSRPSTPANVAAPTVVGDPKVGLSLSVNVGSWSGGGDLAFAEQWLRCDAAGANCAEISGATGPLYTVTGADNGQTIAVEVTATNQAGQATVTAIASAVVTDPTSGGGGDGGGPRAPANVTKPVLIGDAKIGLSLSVSVGSWSGGGDLAFAEQWLRCDAAGGNCEEIAGATTPLYTVSGADLDHRLQVRVTATNEVDSTSASSDPTAAVTDSTTGGDGGGGTGGRPTPPANVAAPTVVGDPLVGHSLGVNQGVWSGGGDLAFADQWLRCDTDGANCVEIDGATTPLYTVTGDDVDHRLQVRVTATNQEGSASTSSALSAVASDAGTGGGDGGGSPSAPQNETPPTLFGEARVGTSLSADAGAWSGGGTLSFAYQWLRCDSDDAASCANIDEATEPGYAVTAADLDHRLAVRVTATNEVDSSAVLSARSDAVVDASPGGGGDGGTPPANDVAPAVSGQATVGSSLTVDQGQWSGDEPIAFEDQWLRCDANGAACASIDAATGASYELTSADVDHTLAVEVTATNAAGSASAASSNHSDVVTAPSTPVAPANVAKPGVNGDVRVGSTLTVDHGQWSGDEPITFEDQWQRCDQDGAGCTAIEGATDASYALMAADVDHRIVVSVRATNAAGSAAADSDPSAVVTDSTPNGGGGSPVAPANTVKPVISGMPNVGARLSADTGRWSGDDPITFEQQWLRCDASGASCDPIASATSATYTLVAADAGHRIVVRVRATNAVSSVTASSDPSAAVTDPNAPAIPANTAKPVITGETVVGRVLSSDAGRWSGGGSPTFAYQWMRCDANAANCAAIAGATTASYTLTAADAGHRLTVGVTATNAAGSASATSDPTALVPLDPFRVLKVKIAKNRTLVLTVQVNAVGKLSANASRKLTRKKTLVYGRKSVNVTTARTVTVKLKPGRKALTLLRKRKRLKLALTLSLTPTATGSRPFTVRRAVTVKKARRAKRKRKPAKKSKTVRA